MPLANAAADTTEDHWTLEMENAPPDDDACCEEEQNWTMDPFFQSEAFVEQQTNEAEAMRNLVYDPEIALLPDTICGEIAEMPDVDYHKFQPIRWAIEDLILRRQIAGLTTPRITEAFAALQRIARNLTDAAEELRDASDDVGRLLHLAYSSPGKRGMKSSLQLLADPLMPKDRDWYMPYLEECWDEMDENDALAMIEAVRRPIATLLELEPKRPRGSPGREFRNSVIRDLAKVYGDVFG